MATTTITYATPEELATIQSKVDTLATRVEYLAGLVTLPLPPAPVPVVTTPPPVIVVPPPPLPTPTGLITPDILNNASFETGWEGFVDWSFGPPGPLNVGGFSCTRSQERAKDGLWSVKSVFAPNGGDGRVEFGYPFAGGARANVYARVWFYLMGALPTTHRKWIRFQTASYGGVKGGLYLSAFTGGVTWCDAANQQIDVDIGIGIPSFNTWHCIEVQYDRTNYGSASGPRARFWYDGGAVVGPSPTKWFPSPATAYWGDEAGVPNPAGPWLYAGAPGGVAAPSAMLVFDDTINGGNTASGVTYYDRIAVSSQRIGL